MKTFRRNLNSYLSCVLFVVFATTSVAQAAKVTGTLTDARSGDPMIGASIMVEGTQIGITTGIDGTFTLDDVPAQGNLVFSYMGYKPQTAAITDNKSYSISLAEDLQSLDEVVVVGYEVKKKSVVTGAISSLSSDELNKAKPANAVNALSGRVSGVNVIATSAQPGTSPKLIIRGVGTNGDSNPLYVVDGLQMSNLDNINANDIASMEVLKDATSTAIYGARGANGVVLVTTKKGTKGRTSFTYDGYYGVSNVQTVTDMMNTEEYLYMMNTIYETSGIDIPSSILMTDNGVDTDWMDVIFDPAQVQEHNVSFSTAGDRGASLVSLGYLNQNGIMGGDKSNYQRFTLRTNNDYNINSYLHVGSNLNIAYVKKASMSTGANGWNPIRYAYCMDPMALPYDSVNGDSAGFGITTSNGTQCINPLAFIDAMADANNNAITLNGNVFAEVRPMENLVIRTDIGSNMGYVYNRSYQDPYYHTANFFNEQSTLTNTSSKSFGWQWENTASYKFSIQDHNFSVLAGISALSSDWETFTASRNGVMDEALTNDAYWYLNAGDVDTATNSGYATNTHTMQSYFGRISYNYQEKYMAEVVVRRDGSSNFGPSNKYATFPGLSFGWNIHNEDFWDVNNFNSLKLRLSWGQNGNESIDSFSYTSIINSDTNYTLGDTSSVVNGSTPDSLVNEDVKWETSEQLNIGVDMSFFDGKLSGSIDWFKKTTKDLLMQPTISGVYGNAAPYYNVGQISNSGIELMASYRNNVGKLNYNVSFNATYLNNNVDKVGNENGYIDGGYWLNKMNVTRMEEGHAMGYFRLYETDGIFNTQEEIDNYVGANGEKIQPDAVPGDFKWVDYNGDGQITDDDRHDMGNPWAKWTLGANISLDYKGFDFTMNITAKTNFKVMASNTRLEDYGSVNLPTFYLDHWSETNTDTNIPRLVTNSYDTNGNYSLPSDFYLYDGDYLSINLMEVGYSIPKRLINKAKIANLRVYVACDNVAKFDRYPFMSTEISDMATYGQDILETGIDYGVYPVARTVRFGANIAF
ncbi:MAG: TonB-dependent receptor [Rikenellaceae bacterium]